MSPEVLKYDSWSIDFVCLFLSKTLAMIKPIAVSQLIDAGELQRLNEYFEVREIQEKVTLRLWHVGKMVILYTNGNPVKDTPYTWGRRHFVYIFATAHIVQICYNSPIRTACTFQNSQIVPPNITVRRKISYVNS